MAPVSPQGPAKKKLPVALLVLFGVLAGPLPMVGVFVWFWWAGHDARAFVRARFAEVRKDPETFVDEAPDEDTRAAYELVAKSSEESIFPLSPSSSTASSLSDWETRVCINPDLTVKGKTRTIGVLVVERKVRGTPKMELTMSVTRSCTCNGRRKPCRLE
jgi:hypothetical protein